MYVYHSIPFRAEGFLMKRQPCRYILRRATHVNFWHRPVPKPIKIDLSRHASQSVKARTFQNSLGSGKNVRKPHDSPNSWLITYRMLTMFLGTLYLVPLTRTLTLASTPKYEKWCCSLMNRRNMKHAWLHDYVYCLTMQACKQNVPVPCPEDNQW